MTRKAFAYKSGDVQCGDWHWAVGIQNHNGRHSQIASINFTACWRRELDAERVAVIMAEALNKEMES